MSLMAAMAVPRPARNVLRVPRARCHGYAICSEPDQSLNAAFAHDLFDGVHEGHLQVPVVIAPSRGLDCHLTNGKMLEQPTMNGGAKSGDGKATTTRTTFRLAIAVTKSIEAPTATVMVRLSG